MSFIINPYAFGGAAFSPDDISGLVVWLAADEITGLSDGDPVATWSDLSGNGNDATEATNTPTYQTNEINSLPIVRFDGINDEMHIADDATLDVSNITIFSVVKLGSGGLAYICNKNYDGSSVAYSLRGQADAANGNFAFFNGSWHTSGQTTAIQNDGLFHVVAGRYDGSTLEYLLDGSVDASSSYSGSLPTTNTQPLYLGMYKNDNAPCLMDMAEILVYNSALGTTDFNNVQAYLDAKYAL